MSCNWAYLAAGDTLRSSTPVSDGTPIQVAVSEVGSTVAILKLAQLIQVSHTGDAKKVTTQTEIKVMGCVPKSCLRKRR